MAGLQCWDSSGNLVVDLGDYNTRYASTVSINFPTSVQSVSVNVSGVTASNSIAVVKSVSIGGIYYYTASCYNGGFTVFYTPSRNPLYAQTVTVEIYQFL